MAFKKIKGGRYDKNLQEVGKWLEYDGGKFKVAYIASPKFVKGYSEITSDKDVENMSEIESKDFKDNLNKILAETILLDWEGVVDENDEVQEYSVEGGIELLEDDPEFAEWLLNSTKEISNYKRETVAEKVKK